MSSEPHVGLSRLSLATGGGVPEHLALKASRACVQELQRNKGNRDSTLRGCTQDFTCTGTQHKAVTTQESGPDLPVGLGRAGVGRVSWGCGSWLWLTSGGKDTGGRSARE